MSAVGRIGRGSGGGMRGWFVADVCGTGRDRGEAGEYHHCDSLSSNSRGGKRGGSLDIREALVFGVGCIISLNTGECRSTTGLPCRLGLYAESVALASDAMVDKYRSCQIDRQYRARVERGQDRDWHKGRVT